MKLLLDTCVWGGAIPELKKAGHDVIWSGDWPEDLGDEVVGIDLWRERRATASGALLREDVLVLRFPE